MKTVTRRDATTPAVDRREARERALRLSQTAVRASALSGLSVRWELPRTPGHEQPPARRSEPVPAVGPLGPRVPRQRRPVDVRTQPQEGTLPRG